MAALLKDCDSRAARERRVGRPAYDASWLWSEPGLDRDAGAQASATVAAQEDRPAGG